jgi:complement component 1 Q subcomponent-binding protein
MMADKNMHHLFLHVDVLKPEQDKSLYFLCGLYPYMLGIHHFSLSPKLDSVEFFKVTNLMDSTNCSFIDRELDERMRDAFHDFIEKNTWMRICLISFKNGCM